MRQLTFESIGGASGDMVLAALIDLGVKLSDLRSILDALPIERFEIKVDPFTDGALSGKQVTVIPPPEETLPERGLHEIRLILSAGSLDPEILKMSEAVFVRLAEAEARVHKTTPDRIHFHEVGAIDSIVDIVGACAAVHLLGVTAVEVGPLPHGTGTVKCRHGVLPVPVPAVVELLGSHPTFQTDEPFELVTPTGAALLMEWKHALPVTAAKAGAGWPGHSVDGLDPSVHRVPCPRPEVEGHLGTCRPTTIHAGRGFGRRRLKGRPNVLKAVLTEDERSEGSRSIDSA